MAVQQNAERETADQPQSTKSEGAGATDSRLHGNLKGCQNLAGGWAPATPPDPRANWNRTPEGCQKCVAQSQGGPPPQASGTLPGCIHHLPSVRGCRRPDLSGLLNPRL